MALLNETQEQYYLGPDGLLNSNDEDYGGYQFVSIKNVINNFIVSFVGQDKLISKIKRSDVAYHAQRGLQEFSFDLLPSHKAIEIEVPPSLSFILPQDYVNYVRLSWTDSNGIERILYPTTLTSNPLPYIQDEEYNYTYDSNGDIISANESETLKRWNAISSDSGRSSMAYSSENALLTNIQNYGQKYGQNPEQSQENGVFYIDKIKGIIQFSSNLVNKICTLKYISDGLGTDEEMVVHKFAEDAIYKYIIHAVLSSRSNVQEYVINRYKRELVAARRNAKIRLSNIKSTQIAQVMRNQSKWIKH
jgi:hypothetical protein